MKVGDLVKYKEDQIRAVVDIECSYHMYDWFGLIIDCYDEPPSSMLFRVKWNTGSCDWVTPAALEVIQ